MPKEFEFPIECPHCGHHETYLYYSANDVMSKTHIIECDECGKPFAADLTLTPRVETVYKMDKVIQK